MQQFLFYIHMSEIKNIKINGDYDCNLYFSINLESNSNVLFHINSNSIKASLYYSKLSLEINDTFHS